MKTKIFALILTLIMVLSITACGAGGTTETEGNDEGITQESIKDDTPNKPNDNEGNTPEETTKPNGGEGNTPEETTKPNDNEGNTPEETTKPNGGEGNTPEETTKPNGGEGNTSEETTKPNEGEEDDDDDYRPDKVAVMGYLSELLSSYNANPYSYIPEAMLPTAESRLVESDSIVIDYSGNVRVSDIPSMGMGEQWNMIATNLAQSQTFYTVLGAIDSVASTSIVVFNNYIDQNPEATAHHSFKEGIYSVTIKCDKDTIYYVLEYETTLPVLGTQAIQIALSMDLDTKVKTVRAQIGDANALTYTVSENQYSFAIKYLGVRRAYFEIKENADGSKEGKIYEFISAAGVADISCSAAEFYITDKYVTAIGNKADGMLAFSGYICELYDVESGEMLAYEVKETLSAIEYNTLWFNMKDIDGINSIKYVPETDDNDAMFCINGTNVAWETKKVGILGGVKAGSRRFDIEFRTQYYFYYDAEEEAYVSVGVSVPMFFVQEEMFNDLEKDVKSTNGIEIEVAAESATLSKLMADYDTLVPIFIQHKDNFSSDDIIAIIGEKVKFD